METGRVISSRSKPKAIRASSGKIDSIIIGLKDEFRKSNLGNPIVLEYHATYSTLMRLKKRRGRNKLIKCEMIPSNIVIRHFKMGSEKRGMLYGEQTGAYKLTFGFGEVFIAKFVFGYREEMRTIAVAHYEVHKTLSKIFEGTKKRQAKPKMGIYRLEKVSGEYVYKKAIAKQGPEIFHKEKDNLFKEVDFFWNNVEMFTRYGMPGVRKLLLSGEPGTGKTSIMVELSKMYQDKCSIALVKDIHDLYEHQLLCSKYNVPGIAILEDVESNLPSNSAVLNFLSGNLELKSKNGFLLLMTTNRIEFIDPRISKRPGRIDKIFKIGMLEKAIARNCAQYYLGDYLELPKTCNIFDKMTGAQIKEIVNSSVIYAVSEKEELSTNIIVATIKKMKEAFNGDETNSIPESKLLLQERPHVGFGYANQAIDDDKLPF